MSTKGTILLLSQVYVPDPASVGQHMADLAAELCRRGRRVVVLAADRGYDDPSRRYAGRETCDGVEVYRLPFSSFGKKSIALRLVGATLFLLQAFVRGACLGNLKAVVVTTSPPMAAGAAVLIAKIRRVPVTYWVMDINPDEIVAAGALKPTALAVRLFERLHRWILRRVEQVVALDRFMADRLRRKERLDGRLTIIPPWPHDEHLESIPHACNPFRREHGLEGKFVLMFSGNVSLVSPVTTVLRAALRLQEEPELVFVFIGGGHGKREIEQTIATQKARNILALPYQPLERLKYSLSAADVHVVTMGDAMTGIIHPCKIYGALRVARPVLFVGPKPSHIADLLAQERIGWHIAHGDIDRAVEAIRMIRTQPAAELEAMGHNAQRLIEQSLSKRLLCGRLCDVIESA